MMQLKDSSEPGTSRRKRLWLVCARSFLAGSLSLSLLSCGAVTRPRAPLPSISLHQSADRGGTLIEVTEEDVHAEFESLPQPEMGEDGMPPSLEPILVPMEMRAAELGRALGESVRQLPNPDEVAISTEAAARIAAHIAEDWELTMRMIRGLDGIVRAQQRQIKALRGRSEAAEQIASDQGVLYRTARKQLLECRDDSGPNPWVTGTAGVVLGAVGGLFGGAHLKQCVGPQ